MFQWSLTLWWFFVHEFIELCSFFRTVQLQCLYTDLLDTSLIRMYIDNCLKYSTALFSSIWWLFCTSYKNWLTPQFSFLLFCRFCCCFIFLASTNSSSVTWWWDSTWQYFDDFCSFHKQWIIYIYLSNQFHFLL